MKINRRKFVQASAAAGAGLMISPTKAFGKPSEYTHFGLNPFILDNPDAVFIMQTNVDTKTNGPEIKSAGLDFGRSVFTLTDDTSEGIPLTHKVVIKPNLTCRQSGNPDYTVEGTMGIVTDAFFVEGVIESLKELGIPSNQFFIREVNCPQDLADGGYPEMAARTGIDLQAINTPVSQLAPEQVVWVDIPDGAYFNKLPYLWPVNAPDTWLLNIAKFKAHGMGLTLCAKNLQGTIAMKYQAHCTTYGQTMSGVDPEHIKPNVDYYIHESYLNHKEDGIPRWDKPGTRGGLWMETWANRCLDNNSVNFAGLHIIEGIYGRDGDFVSGPGDDGLATDFMTNYIIFGRNQFNVDNIGFYLGGHEPGNFGLLHLAKERGFDNIINPAEIPTFYWDPLTGPISTELSDIQRFPLLTYYLQKDYDGQTEAKWHMVDEAYDYGPTAVKNVSLSPHDFYMKEVYPNPVRSLSTIRFYVPRHGNVTIEVINGNGQVVDVLCDRQIERGNHAVHMNSTQYSSGFYVVRMVFEGSVDIQKVMVTH